MVKDEEVRTAVMDAQLHICLMGSRSLALAYHTTPHLVNSVRLTYATTRSCAIRFTFLIGFDLNGFT